ncbi:uncharacterized protein LOC115749318 [Rhodamnia argentea]|uniref:Uncharacterized protein LOC115749318 n=1 Tax=Rhodamnia argentea TaxID=178133 RepID=A0A8B8Q4E4_9MYRT|nr:uncharacterized protein LOC115749318 [Rhodamnia argentea]
MPLLTLDACWAQAGDASPTRFIGASVFKGEEFIGLNDTANHCHATWCSVCRVSTSRALVRCSAKRSRRYRRPQKIVDLDLQVDQSSSKTNVADRSSSTVEDAPSVDVSSNNSSANSTMSISSRGTVLQACAVTSGFMVALGAIIREASHVAFMEGLTVIDCTKAISFSFETWHLELVTGLVILISSCRYLLLRTWPEFAESSEAANRQVLTSLEPVDYLVVSFLPGIGEELLFRGTLLPLSRNNWNSVLLVAALFGILHLGSGRKYSFAIWASFVGLMYGSATMISSSIVVPMLSHSLNNLVGGMIWQYLKSESSE